MRASDERMLTTEEVARWFGIAPRTVCTWAECSELPAVKIGRQWRFRRDEIEKWLARPNRLQVCYPAASAAAAAKTAYKS
jgi:excisionase family DNA binding protein